MTPITFTCRETIALPGEEIASGILDVSRWPEFRGYGPLPGIRSAEFEVRTPEVVGSRIRAVNTDGTTHVEEITQWRPEQRVQLRLSEFSPPVSQLATDFVETWDFACHGEATEVSRSLELHPKSAWTKPVLWMVSQLLKRAIQRHLKEMKPGE